MSDLALFGGDPIRKTPFYSWPRVVDGQQEKLIDTLLNDSWGIGSESIKELEEKEHNLLLIKIVYYFYCAHMNYPMKQFYLFYLTKCL